MNTVAPDVTQRAPVRNDEALRGAADLQHNATENSGALANEIGAVAYWKSING